MKQICLDTISKTIRAVLAGAPSANQPTYIAYYTDAEEDGTLTEGSSDGELTGVTAKTLVAAPGADVQRTVHEIVIYNADTASVTLTVYLDNGGSQRKIEPVTLAVGAMWCLSAAGLPDGSAGTPWDGDIADINLDGGTDIGAALADADLILVDDGGTGTNRKSAISRLWTYISSKLTGYKLDDLGTPDDNTDLNASTSAHGLLAKLPNDAAKYLNGVGSWVIPDLVLTASPGSDHSATGIKVALTAGANVSFGDVCYIKSDSKMGLVDADAIATAGALFMCADASIANNASGNWLMIGVARDDTWNWTVGGLIYISTTGTTGDTLTQTAPSGTDDVVQIVGVALTADIMLFFPQLVMVERT